MPVRRPSSTSGLELFGLGIVAFVGIFGIQALTSWVAMLLLGMIHHDFDSRVPALGFWTVLFLGAVLRLLIQPISSSKD